MLTSIRVRWITFGLLICIIYLTIGVKSDCPMPDPPSNGQVFSFFGLAGDSEPPRSEVPDDEEVFFECEPKYNLVGKDSIRCTNGKFLSEPPVCKRERCDEPYKPDHGVWTHYITNPDGSSGGKPNPGDEGYYFENNYVQLTCHKGFELVNRKEHQIKCLASGQLELEWKGNHPKCQKRAYCGDPGTSFDGQRKGKSFYRGDRSIFSCNDGFELIGPKSIVCQSDGKWDHPKPRCKPEKVCPDLHLNEFGEIKSQTKTGDYFVEGDEALIVCHSGYRLTGDGSDRVYCNANETESQPFWDEEIASCEVIDCPVPESPKYGYIKEISNTTVSFPYKFEITFACVKGYKLVGNSWSICEDTGWKGKTPQCAKIFCDDPGTPENGFKSGTRPYKIGNRIKFRCFDEYRLEGSSVRTCLENGKWNGELTRCVRETTYCPDPGIPERGGKSGSDYDYGSVVKFACGQGYTLFGSENRSCLANRQWDGQEATCVASLDFDRPDEVSFRLLSNIDNAVILMDTHQDSSPFKINNGEGEGVPGVGVGAIATDRKLDVHSYTAGNLVIYFVFDSSGSIGETNFNQSVDFAKALVQRVGVSKDGVRFGAVSFGATVKSHFYPFEDEDTESVIQRLNQIKYQGGGTATADALATIRNDHIVTSELRLKKPKSIVFLFTDGIFNIGGDPRPTAADLKKNYDVEFFCIAINGQINNKQEMNLKSLDEICNKDSQGHSLPANKNNLYKLQSYTTLGWMVDDVLEDNIDYSRCGLPVKMEVEDVKNDDDDDDDEEDNKLLARISTGGREVKIYWPWMARLTLLKEGKKSRCGGSLVDREWILTAAHCLVDMDVKDVKVELGITNLTSKMIPAKQLFIHKEYDDKTKDNDVALIQLEHVADYHQRVRPICKSPSEEDLNKNGNVNSFLYGPLQNATVIGYGAISEKWNESFSKVLRELNVTIRSQETCQESLKNTNHTITERMLCAGDKTSENDACAGDSGGPLMQFVSKDTGDGYWVQVGIVSWGIHDEGKKCGKPGFYGAYTRMSKVVDWIDKTIQKN